MVSYQQYETLLEQQVIPPTAEELFDFQVAVLRDKEVLKSPDELLPLRRFLPKAPFRQFWIIPDVQMSLDELMSRVVLGEKKGRNYLNETAVENAVAVPKGHYLVLDVEDGRRMLKTSPDRAVEIFSQEDRSAYVCREGIFHVMYFPETLRNHYMDLSGSRYGAESVPYLCLDEGQPRLYYYWSGGANPKWGSPSCGSRRGLG